MGYHPVTVTSPSIAMHHMDMSLWVILTLLIIKSFDHLYQKDQNIRNKTLSTGTLTKES